MRIILIWAIVMSCTLTALGQIGGLGGTKIGAYTAFTFGTHHVEFEPTFSSTRMVDGNTVETQSSVSWRLTYTLSDQWEIGFGAPNDFSNGAFAAKYNFKPKENSALAAMVGITTPFGNRVFDKDQRSIDDLTVFGVGLISSWNIGERDGIDLSVQYQDYFKPIGNESPGSLFINMDYGHYIFNNTVMLILAAQHYSSNFGGPMINVTSLLPGIALEMKDNFALIINTQHDIITDLAAPTHTLNVTLTTMW